MTTTPTQRSSITRAALVRLVADVEALLELEPATPVAKRLEVLERTVQSTALARTVVERTRAGGPV
jgi:hypothetical protein